MSQKGTFNFVFTWEDCQPVLTYMQYNKLQVIKRAMEAISPPPEAEFGNMT